MWGVVGSTGQWPAVVNMWEEDGWDGLARSFGHELGHAHLQDPKLARWWATAAEFRSGGFDRLLVPAEWSPTITELCAQGAGGGAYAHDQIRVPAGTGTDFLELARDVGGSFYETHGWRLAGAWQTALGNDNEVFLLWSIPTWEQWSAAEAALRAQVTPGGHASAMRWRTSAASSWSTRRSARCGSDASRPGTTATTAGPSRGSDAGRYGAQSVEASALPAPRSSSSWRRNSLPTSLRGSDPARWKATGIL